MEHLRTPIIRISFLVFQNAVFDIIQGLIRFPHLTMAIKTEEHFITYIQQNAKRQQTPTIPSDATTTFIANVNAKHQYRTTGILNPTEQQKGCRIKTVISISMVRGKEIHTRICIPNDHVYTIKTSNTLATFLVLSPEQIKQLKPICTAAPGVLRQENCD